MILRSCVAPGLLLGTLIAGCGSDPAGSGGAGTTGSGAGGAGGGAASCAVQAAPEVTDVSGRWALRMVGSQLVQAPGFADPFHNSIVSVMLVDQTQTGEAVSLDAQYCDHYTEDPDAVVHAVIPDAYKESLKPVARSGTFAAGEGGLRYQLPTFHEVVGATLAEPATEALPTEPTDMRVVDQDADGKPAITIRLTGLVDGEVYVVERKATALDGVAVSADRVEGLVTFSSEQSVVQADPEFLQDSVANSERRTDPEPCNSHFTMVRVADDADCAYVRDNAEALFP